MKCVSILERNYIITQPIEVWWGRRLNLDQLKTTWGDFNFLGKRWIQVLIYKNVKNFQVHFSSCLSFLSVKRKGQPLSLLNTYSVLTHMVVWRSLKSKLGCNLICSFGQAIVSGNFCLFRNKLTYFKWRLRCLMCREPRGFAFVQFVDPYEAAEAQHHMNGKRFAGREISVVLAAESRKRPEEMRQRHRFRYISCLSSHLSTHSSHFPSSYG